MKLRLCILALSLILFASPVFAATYTIDSAHTQVQFKVKHMGISNVNGAFADFEGTFEFDPKNIAASKTTAKIVAKSIDTANDKRDTHLRSADFLNIEKFPSISFVSKEVKDVDGESFKVVGDLNIHGVTKTVTLDVEFNGAVTDPWGKERAGFSASTKINRKDFGLTWSKLLETGGLVVDDMVKIELEVEGIKAN